MLFQRDCGATTSFTTQISILTQADAYVVDRGNVFIADDAHSRAKAGTWGGPWANVSWITDDHLLIRYANESRIFEQEDRFGHIQITYQAVSH